MNGTHFTHVSTLTQKDAVQIMKRVFLYAHLTMTDNNISYLFNFFNHLLLLRITQLYNEFTRQTNAKRSKIEI